MSKSAAIKLGESPLWFLLPVLLLSTLSARLPAQDYVYTTNDGAITITGYVGSGGDVVIPSQITGLPVTSIGDNAFGWAFGGTMSFINVTIPRGITNIGNYAFSTCLFMQDLTISDSVTRIGDWAFYNCEHLTNVTIGNSIVSIGDGAFWNCWGMTNVTLPKTLTSIGTNAFFECNFSSISIPDSVTNLGNGAFDGCQSLTNVTIGKNVTSIGREAFSHCGSLRSVTIPNTVTSIGDLAFSDCMTLSRLTIGNSVASIAQGAFAGCFYLTGVYFKGSAPTLGSYVFDDPNTALYYLPGTTNWGPTLAGYPAVPWNPQVQTSDSDFGVQGNQFGFTISGTSNITVLVEACTNLASPSWSAVGTNTLTTGYSHFSDPGWTNSPARFYRLRSP